MYSIANLINGICLAVYNELPLNLNSGCCCDRFNHIELMIYYSNHHFQLI